MTVEPVLDDVVRVELVANGVGVLLSRSSEDADDVVLSDSLEELFSVWSKEDSDTLIRVRRGAYVEGFSAVVHEVDDEVVLDSLLEVFGVNKGLIQIQKEDSLLLAELG